ncbi:uncharacterized protein [Ptychodera flava]|uniref:uncharacterized protein n=1 Tax=Ptychodera flava TaxID=63121 RepID=UPI00396A9827
MTFFGTFADNPVWSVVPEDKEGNVGEDVSFHCRLTGLSEDGPLPRWEHKIDGTLKTIISIGGESFSECCKVYGNFDSGEYNLLIQNITHKHEGVWQCTHVQAVPQIRGATLKVSVSPEWESSPEDVNATIGGEVRLSCWLTSLDKDDPKPRWEHTRNGETHAVSEGDQAFLPNCQVFGNFSIGEYNLLIKSVTSEDEGTWRCSHDQANPRSQSGFLTVKEVVGEESSDKTTTIVIVIVSLLVISSIVILIVFIAKYCRRNPQEQPHLRARNHEQVS